MEDIQKKYNSRIFEEILKEMEETHSSNVLEDTEPQDITESININLTDETIDKSNCSLIAYGMHVDEDDDVDAYNYKNNPDKAVDILLEYPDNNIKIEIFLDTESKEWDSNINGNCGKLSPEQMEQFFNSNFYKRLKSKLHNDWPEEGDELFSQLNNAIDIKRYRIDGFENSGEEDQIEEGKIRTRDVDKGKPNEKNASGKIIRSSSGRKLVSFSDQGVSKGDERYYSWPGGMDEKSIFRWSRWQDWNKQRPWVRMRFTYNVGVNPDTIGITLTPFERDDKNRGFKSFDLSLTPILQYLTPEETEQILNLSIVRKFIKTCIDRISKVLSIPDEEIFNKINRPDKCTLDDIRNTKRVFKNTLKALREYRADTFIYD